MSYNGSGTFNINSTGQPVVAGTIISSASFNALTADLATGLTTAITKDGQTATTARILFAQGINSTLVTDASSVSTGSIFTAGGVGIAKKLYVGTDASIAGTLTYGGVTLTNAVTGTGKMVLDTSPTITTATLASANLTTALTLAGAAGSNGQVLTSAGSGLPTWTSPSGGFTSLSVSTSSGTFTIPSGIATIKVTVIGAGGGGAATNGPNPGVAGGNTTLASGTQTITTLTGGGGGGALAPNATDRFTGGLGGTATNGTINAVGNGGSSGSGSSGGGSIFGGGAPSRGETKDGFNGSAYGGGGGGASGVNSAGGGGGGAAIKYLTGLTPGNTLTVTIGAGGAGGAAGGNAGGTGANGAIIFEY